MQIILTMGIVFISVRARLRRVGFEQRLVHHNREIFDALSNRVFEEHTCRFGHRVIGLFGRSVLEVT